MSILLKNCKYIVTQNDKRQILKNKDILIEGNKISEIGKVKSKADETISCSGLLAMPGLINMHTHAGMGMLRGISEDLSFFPWLEKVWKYERKFKAKDVYEGSMISCWEMLRTGTTTFFDMYYFEDETAKAMMESGLRGYLGWVVLDSDKTSQKGKPIKNCERFVKKFKKKKRIVPHVAPHAIYTCSEKNLIKSKKLAEKNKTLLHIHVSETRKEVADCYKEHKKRPVEYLDSIGFLGKNVIAAHCGWLTKREVGIFGRRKVTVAHCPISNMKLGIGGAAPVPEMLKAGVNVTLGTDSVVSNNTLDMFQSMKFCALLHKNFRWDPSIITSQQVLDFATRNSAKALGLNAGSLEKGKLADIIFLDLRVPQMNPMNDPIANIVYSVNGSAVDTVIVDGRILMRENKVLTLKEKDLIGKKLL